jgi:biotin carboxylase
MTRVAFAAPYGLESTLRFVRSALTLPDVRLGIVSQDSADAVCGKLPPEARDALAGYVRVTDMHDSAQTAKAVVELGQQMGGKVERLIGILESLQVPLAEVREQLGIRGMDCKEAERFREKSVMKDALRAAGLPCARHRLASSTTEALAFARQVMPLVAKPPAGAGGKDTFRVEQLPELEAWLRSVPPTKERPLLLEEFLSGTEHSFDSVTVGGRTVFHSISDYTPTPLTVLETPWIQWTVMLPRSIDGPEYAAIRHAGPRAVETLGMVNGLSHMEWFRRPDGSIAISEVGARPPGAQITSLLSYAHDHDFYRAWAEVVIYERFEAPQRRFAAGAAYLRGQGEGRVSAVEGVEAVRRELGGLVIEAKLPQIGQPKSSSYEGEGYVIVRHPETEVVKNALERIVSIMRVHLR